MGLISGSSSFTRFVVNGKLPETYAEDFPENIERFAFRKLDESSEEERSAGWVNIMDPLDNEFLGREYFKEPYLALSYRIDVRGVPGKALRQFSAETENEIKREEGLDYLPKGRRLEIREGVRIKLLKRAIPRTNTYDMVWDLTAGTVILGAVNNKLCDEFAEYFAKTFGLGLTTVFPFSLASEVLEKEGKDPQILENLGPARLEAPRGAAQSPEAEFDGGASPEEDPY